MAETNNSDVPLSSRSQGEGPSYPDSDAKSSIGDEPSPSASEESDTASVQSFSIGETSESSASISKDEDSNLTPDESTISSCEGSLGTMPVKEATTSKKDETADSLTEEAESKATAAVTKTEAMQGRKTTVEGQPSDLQGPSGEQPTPSTSADGYTSLQKQNPLLFAILLFGTNVDPATAVQRVEAACEGAQAERTEIRNLLQEGSFVLDFDEEEILGFGNRRDDPPPGISPLPQRPFPRSTSYEDEFGRPIQNPEDDDAVVPVAPYIPRAKSSPPPTPLASYIRNTMDTPSTARSSISRSHPSSVPSPAGSTSMDSGATSSISSSSEMPSPVVEDPDQVSVEQPSSDSGIPSPCVEDPKRHADPVSTEQSKSEQTRESEEPASVQSTTSGVESGSSRGALKRPSESKDLDSLLLSPLKKLATEEKGAPRPGGN